MNDLESRLQEQVAAVSELTNDKQTLEVLFIFLNIDCLYIYLFLQFECKLLHEQVEEIHKEIESGKVISI